MKNKDYPLAALVGTGALNLVHTASHVIPALGALGSVANTHTHDHELAEVGYLVIQNTSFLEQVEKALSNPIMQIAYLAFVPLSFIYIYRDHKQHKYHQNLESELTSARSRIIDLEFQLESNK